MQKEFETNKLLKSKTLHVFDLLMNEEGFADFSTEVKKLNKKIPQVYVHVCVDKICKNQILRIGKATIGIIERWIKVLLGMEVHFYGLSANLRNIEIIPTDAQII
ncbi:hypothetical protein [Hydrogenimonas sp. SS33]|uniref:hypothetical protein n=1 Tax=Hydrogenimonas leucolamina TaxID=2954236 RepID=UPI00336BC153